MPAEKRFGKFGHVGIRSCQSVLPGTTRHRDRYVVLVAQSEEVKVIDAFPVRPSTRGAPPRSRFAKASRLRQHRKPAPKRTSDATGVAPQLRGMRGEIASDMTEGTALTRRRGQGLEEGLGSGSGADGQAQPDDKRDWYGQRLVLQSRI